MNANEVEEVINQDPMDLEEIHQHDCTERIVPAMDVHESSVVRNIRFTTVPARGEVCVVEVKRDGWKDWVKGLVKVLHVD